jgi:WhiB family redox-sensing transcriptional regulator
MTAKHRERDWLNHPKRWVDHLPYEGIEVPEWMEDAACANTDPEAYFAQNKGDPENVRAARALCRECPVRPNCLEYALVLQGRNPGSLPGIWGGTSENQRINLLRKRAAS